MNKAKSIWQEGRYYDAWILVHFLSGIVLGFGMLVLNFQVTVSYILALVLIVCWEFFEMIADIKEHKENRLGDIATGLLGFISSFSVSPIFIHNFMTPLIFSSILFALASLVGWIKYIKYGR